MSNKISRRAFLKVTGVSALALGAASMLGGCQSSSGSVEVKVGDKVSNWNNLGVQLSSVFTLSDAPDVAGHQYVAVLVTAVNRSKTDSMAIGAQNIAEIDAAYPLTDEASRAANTAPYFHALSASTTDFTVTVDGQAAEAGAYVSLYDAATESFSDAPSLPPQGTGYIELVCMVPCRRTLSWALETAVNSAPRQKIREGLVPSPFPVFAAINLPSKTVFFSCLTMLFHVPSTG